MERALWRGSIETTTHRFHLAPGAGLLLSVQILNVPMDEVQRVRMLVDNHVMAEVATVVHDEGVDTAGLQLYMREYYLCSEEPGMVLRFDVQGREVATGLMGWQKCIVEVTLSGEQQVKPPILRTVHQVAATR